MQTSARMPELHHRAGQIKVWHGMALPPRRLLGKTDALVLELDRRGDRAAGEPGPQFGRLPRRGHVGTVGV